MAEIFKKNTKVLGLLLITIFGIIYLFYTYINTKRDQDYNALQIAKTAVANFPIEELEKLDVAKGDIHKPEYELIKNDLTSILKVNSNVKFTYLYALKNDQICLMVDCRVAGLKRVPPGTVSLNPDPIYFEPFKTGNPVITYTTKDEFGKWVSTLIPIKNPVTKKTIAIFAMDYDSKLWYLPILSAMGQSLLVVILTAFIFLFFLRIKIQNDALKKELEERLKSDLKLKRSEEKLNEVFKNSQDVFYKTTLDGIIIEVSDSVENFIDHKKEELLGINVSDLYYNSNDREKLIEIITKEGTVMDYEIKMKFKEDEVKYVLLNSTLVLDTDQTPQYIKGAIKDVTARRSAEEKLIESESLLRAIIDNQPECIKIVDSEGSLLMMNPAGLEMIEADSLEQVKGARVLDLVTPDFQKSFTDLHKEVIRGKHGKLEFEIQGLKGTKRWMKTSAVPMILNEKTVLLAHTRDISEHKVAEERLEKSEQFLRESQQIGRIGSYEFDIEGQTWQSSEVLDKIFGIDPNYEKTVENWTTIIHPEDMVGMYTYLNKVVADKTEFNKEYRIIRKNDGAERWVHAIGAFVYDQSGNQPKMVGVIQDITKQKDAEKELRIAKEKAEESERLKTAFLANMSHEIRTPMNGILGFTELLKEPNLSGEKQLEYINIIRKSGNRMLNIINDIIDISKIESGLMKVSNSQVNVNEINQYIHAFFKHEATSEGIELYMSNELPTETAFINSDKQKITNILTNLVKNALKFTHKGSIEFGYELNSDTNELEFFVKDTGDGIDITMQEIIFERFRQTSETTAKNYEGAGLGLAITKSFVEMLGGKIWVKSELGKGSTFYFTLPYNPQLIINNKIKVEKTDPDKQEDVKDLKILLAEDDEISAKLLEISVKGISKTVLRARNGIEAVDLAKKNPDIDLILMDIQMPKMDGYEAIAEIRKFNPEVIIVAQTAFVFADEIQKIEKAGANGHISKPVKKIELMKIVHKYFMNPSPSAIA